MPRRAGAHGADMLTTPLHAAQREAGAKMIDFGGWDMPVQFAGITAEHHAVRQRCGVFDVSHMGRLRIQGPRAGGWLDRVVCRRCSDLAPGQVRYGLILAGDGGAIDDVLVARESADSFHMVVNAGNRTAVLTHLAGVADAGARVEDLTAVQAMIAVQGPQAAALLAGLGLDPGALKAYRFADARWQGADVRISRTGYTGEDGAELFVPAERVVELWRAVVAAGAAPCGLGARDTLRLEAGMPLYGHELDRRTTPLEAGLRFAVNPAGGFIGDACLAAPLRKTLVGLRVPSRRVPRQGYAISSDGTAIGSVTSGTLSPTLGAAIAMAFVPPDRADPGRLVQVDLRGTAVEAEVVPLPFYRRAR